jgi:hypothetical protein
MLDEGKADLRVALHFAVYQPDHELTAAVVAHAYHADRSLLPWLLEVPELASSWRDGAERRLQAASR